MGVSPVLGDTASFRLPSETKDIYFARLNITHLRTFFNLNVVNSSIESFSENKKGFRRYNLNAKGYSIVLREKKHSKNTMFDFGGGTQNCFGKTLGVC